MAHSISPPKTPTKQIGSNANMDLDTSVLDGIDLDGIGCTPSTKHQMISLKRKASQVFGQGSPTTTQTFLKWRLAVVESKLRVRSIQKQAFAEASTLSKEIGKLKTDFLTLIKEDEKSLLSEKTFLLTQRKILEEDLNDTIGGKDQLVDAYITELRISLDAASSSKEKLTGLKSPRLDRKHFQNIVEGYLGTKCGDPGSEIRWCNVLGFWVAANSVKCAHIVPFSWNTKEMAHMFGNDEPPLSSRRNGLSLQSKIEEAFDNCWIAVVPMNSFRIIPTEWKIVLLNSAEKDNTFFTDNLNITDRRLWRWRDIDGRKLSFLNDNRPARRYLYMRYALAWLHAETKAWPAFKERFLLERYGQAQINLTDTYANPYYWNWANKQGTYYPKI